MIASRDSPPVISLIRLSSIGVISGPETLLVDASARACSMAYLMSWGSTSLSAGTGTAKTMPVLSPNDS